MRPDPAWPRVLEVGDLAERVARRYGRSPEERDDLRQEALLAMHRAAASFDHRRGSWRSYAATAARQRVRRESLRGRLPVYVGARRIEVLRRLRAALQGLEADGEPATVERAAAEVGIGAHTARRLLWADRVAPLDQPLGHDPEASTLADLVPDHDAADPEAEAERTERRAAVRAAVAELEPGLREVVVRRWGLDGAEPGTLAEVGAEVGISPETVRQRERRALVALLAEAGEL